MSFPCPVEGCTSVYPDWKSLEEHLSAEHGQKTTKEQYDSWRASISLTEQEQQRNRDQTGPLLTPLERDVSLSVPSDTSLACPICQKVFDKGDLMSSFNSVKMHAIKSHGRQLQPSEFGLGEEERAPSPPRRPAVRAEEGRPSIPDPYEHLRQMLITFGLGDKNAGAVCKFMESYSVDDLYKLIEGAAEYLPRSRLKLFVESWANVRGIPIAPEIQEELGISNMPTSYGRYGSQQQDYRYGRRDRDWKPEPKDEVSQIIDKEYDEARKIRVIRALHDRGEDGSEVQGLRQEITALRQMMSEGLSNRETEKISELEDEIREKDRKLQEEKEQRHRNEMKALEERMDSRMEALKSSQGTVFERQSVKAAERLGDISERMVTLGEKLIVSTAFKHGILEPEQPLTREREGPGGIEDLIPAEYIERSVKEAVDA